MGEVAVYIVLSLLGAIAVYGLLTDEADAEGYQFAVFVLSPLFLTAMVLIDVLIML